MEQIDLLVKNRFLKWLQPEGIDYLKNIQKEHGTLLAVWNEGGIPHCVHFREGMQIRNWMRDQPEFKGKDFLWFDNNWAEFTKVCMDAYDKAMEELSNIGIDDFY